MFIWNVLAVIIIKSSIKQRNEEIQTILKLIITNRFYQKHPLGNGEHGLHMEQNMELAVRLFQKSE